LQDAWRTPGATRDYAKPDIGSLQVEYPPDNSRARRDADYQAYKDRLSNAWRNPAAAANAVERQGEQWRGGR
jgi:hypothetical protein